MNGAKIHGLVHYSEIENKEEKEQCQKIIDTIPTVDDIYVNPKTGFQTRYEQIGFLFNGPFRFGVFDCPKWAAQKYPNRCKPMKNAGISRRCPNSDQVE